MAIKMKGIRNPRNIKVKPSILRNRFLYLYDRLNGIVAYTNDLENWQTVR